MDPISVAIASLNFPIVTDVSILLDSTLFFGVCLLALLAFFEPRNDKRLKVVRVMVLAFILAISLKEIMKVQRPCIEFPAKIPCPEDYSFPSSHAAVAFALMIAFINKPTYPFFIAFAIFIAFSRVYLGVHTVDDVLAGLVIAPIAYQLVDLLWKKK
jgi:membrane-associated phospholipid phosphatase